MDPYPPAVLEHGTGADKGPPPGTALLLALAFLWRWRFGISVNFIPRVKQVMVENSGGGMGAGSFQSR